jgi:hypothetical protein
MVNIEIGQRWVCIKDVKFETDCYWDEYNFSRFDIIDVIKLTAGFIICVKNGNESCTTSLMKSEILNNFITQAEWRDEQLNLLLEDDD